jgi:hypothetical protein
MLQKKRKNNHLNTYTEERFQLTFSDWPSFVAPGSLKMVLFGCLCAVRIAYWTQTFNCLKRDSVPDIHTLTNLMCGYHSAAASSTTRSNLCVHWHLWNSHSFVMIISATKMIPSSSSQCSHHHHL